MAKPRATTYGVTRALIEQPDAVCLHKGQWANAYVYKVVSPEGGVFVVKDFKQCNWLVRNTWGRLMVRREYRLMKFLEGLEGIPPKVFRLDGFAMGMAFVAGRTFYECYEGDVPVEVFHRLEKLMNMMHERGVAHLDARNPRNVIVSETGIPYLLDFQSGMFLRWFPQWVRRLMCLADISGVYKHWGMRSYDTLDEAHKELLRRHFKLRRLWVLCGYSLWRRREPKELELKLFAEVANKKGGDSCSQSING